GAAGRSTRTRCSSAPPARLLVSGSPLRALLRVLRLLRILRDLRLLRVLRAPPRPRGPARRRGGAHPWGVAPEPAAEGRAVAAWAAPATEASQGSVSAAAARTRTHGHGSHAEGGPAVVPTDGHMLEKVPAEASGSSTR